MKWEDLEVKGCENVGKSMVGKHSKVNSKQVIKILEYHTKVLKCILWAVVNH